MVLLVGSFTMGLILALLALGVLVTFRVLGFRDLTVDGSITLGAAVVAALIVKGVHPVWATCAAFAAGMAAGSTTALLHTRLGINGLLAGILVMTALYSVNLRVMGKSNMPLLSQATLFQTAHRLAGEESRFEIWGWQLQHRDLWILIMAALIVAALATALLVFFRTNLGLAMRATGDNPQMIKALGVDVGWMLTLGVALSNGLVAVSGALLAQYQGFADVQMGIGMVVWGLASMIIGETLVGEGHLGLLVAGAVMGSVLFRLLVAIALRWGLNPNDLKLVTALFVLGALALPELAARWRAVKGAA
jgi:putative ABC transport system permease protein